MNLQKTFVFVKTTQVSHLNSGRQLLGLTLRVNPWLWNWAQVRTTCANLCVGYVFDNSMLRTECGYVSLA